MSDSDLSTGPLASPPSAEEMARRVRARARELGLWIGITTPDVETGAHMRRWVAQGYHGAMAYLARPDALDRREDLKKTMPEVRSVVVAADPYPADDPEGIPDDPSRAVIARYARGRDYHKVLTRKLRTLLASLPGVTGRVYVDTGPVLERELGRRAGLGWFGRNTMLIHPRRGSYFFLGVILLDAELPPDPPFEADRCGSCRACLDACPTGALLGRDEHGAPVMDARRCISYLTIEHRGPIPEELRPLLGNRVFGCDICQEVCPWNERFAAEAGEAAYGAREVLQGPGLPDLAASLLSMDDEGFRSTWAGTAVRRAGREGLLRNVCVALGNLGSDEVTPVLTRAANDSSPVVREHARWALDRTTAADNR